MVNTASELQTIVNDFFDRMNQLDEEQFSIKTSPTKWSKKEVVGHLIDSAQNNLRRFICAQYEPAPPKITYDQDFWVDANNYQQMNQEDILLLWKLINLRIVAVLEKMPKEHYHKQAETSGLFSIQWLAEDYVKHLKHHLNQVIAGSFNIVYP